LRTARLPISFAQALTALGDEGQIAANTMRKPNLIVSIGAQISTLTVGNAVVTATHIRFIKDKAGPESVIETYPQRRTIELRSTMLTSCLAASHRHLLPMTLRVATLYAAGSRVFLRHDTTVLGR
jgi:hypothetical protein